MTATSPDDRRSQAFNVPNQITAVRLLLAVAVFVLIALKLYLAALVCFLIAAGTDWLDGYWARKYNQITQIGRVFDPFVDKIIICGAFIFLAAVPNSGIAAWMAVVVVAREMLVTALRSFIEQGGGDFSAKMSGKLKMVLQCAAVAASLICLIVLKNADVLHPALSRTLTITVWASIALTVYSGVEYIVVAARMLRA